MNSKFTLLTFKLLICCLFFGYSAFGQWSNGQAADLVLGQPDLNSNTADNGGIGANTLDGCSGIAIDFINNKIYVADDDNNRVLRYSYPITSNQQAAEVVFGQPNFTSSSFAVTQSGMDNPKGLAVDNTGRLWVGENGNRRVIWFNAAHNVASNGANADGVLGQPDFTTNTFGVTQSKTSRIEGISISSSGTLWVTDSGNQRVLRFDNAAAKSNGANADGVLGQTNFNSNSSGLNQSKFTFPYDLYITNNGTLWITDAGNNRVLRFDNAAAKSNGANADGVLGQPDFTTKTANITQSGMNEPVGAKTDGQGRLYVSDQSNHRIIIFDDAANKSNGANADNVLGQSNFTSNTSGVSATAMNPGFLSAVAVDDTNDLLWFSDTNNNRAIRYSASSSLLPVELTDFRAKIIEDKTELAWQTASETNNEGFEIQRSIDGNNWQNIGYVNGRRTAYETSNYQFTDARPNKGINYYRLKQMDYDGAFEYSDMVSVEIAVSRKLLAVSPNPVQNGELTLYILDEDMEQATLEIFNTVGQLVQTEVLTDSETVIRTDNLPTGMYWFSVNVDGKKEVRKVIIE